MSRIFIIAEAGVNHNGSLELAMKLVECAAAAGADCVKFQTFKSESLVSASAPKADYQKLNTASDETQFEMLKKLELSQEDFCLLKKRCDDLEIMFLSTPFDFESADFLKNLGMKIFKIPSGEITNLPYLRKINSYATDVILSTGMSTLEEIEMALQALSDSRVKLLHCTTDYPCSFSNVNLRAMETMRIRFGLPLGYSDHTNGTEVAVAAAALGAEIIEKHFTLDKTMEGPDHKASLNPDELKSLVFQIRNIELAMGDGIKKPMPDEIKNISVARRSIVAACPIKKGEFIEEHMLTLKRPATGLSPMLWDSIIGSKAKKHYEKGELI